jgi:arylsulfatase
MSAGVKNKANGRRDLLLGTSAIVAAATLTSKALAQAQKAEPATAPQPAASPTSSSSSMTTSVLPMSAPIPAG